MRFIGLILLAAALNAAAQERPATPLIESPNAKVTSDDFEAFLLRVPENHRAEARASNEWIGKAVDQVFENRVLALEAKRLGLEKDPQVALRMKQVEEAYMAQLWADSFRKRFKAPDLTERARELYLVNKDKYRLPERVTGQHLFISLQGRTKEMAKAIADDIVQRVRGGQSLATLAEQFSEDPNFKRTKGHFEEVPQANFDAGMGRAVFALAKKGDVTEPIETPQGYHVFQLEAKLPARQRTFDEVKESILAEETERVTNLAAEKEVRRLKGGPNETVVHTKAIEALRVDLDRAAIEKAHREAAEELYLKKNPGK